MKNHNLISTGRQGLPTLSEDANYSSENPIRHEIHFPAPDDASRMEILRHHITTRNLFAFRLGRPLVGLTYYQALTDLHERLLAYMPQDVDCAKLNIRYLVSGSLHNVANNPAAGAGLFAWTESSGIRWLEGWREAFVHCVGMYDRLRGLPEARDISHASRMLLERLHVELQARIEACEARLSAFNFDDIWLTSAWPSTLPYRAFDRLRHFLIHYYQKAYKCWPPAVHGSNDRWLTRELVQRLQTDFGILYDLYVDRRRGWDKDIGTKTRGDIYMKSLDGDNFVTEALMTAQVPSDPPSLPTPASDNNRDTRRKTFETKYFQHQS